MKSFDIDGAPACKDIVKTFEIMWISDGYKGGKAASHRHRGDSNEEINLCLNCEEISGLSDCIPESPRCPIKQIRCKKRKIYDDLFALRKAAKNRQARENAGQMRLTLDD